MKRNILIVFFCLFSLASFGQYKVFGGSKDPYLAVDESITQVYLLNGLSGARISFTSEESYTHKWYKYNKYANQSEPVDCVQFGNTSTITDISDGYGYYVGETISSLTRHVWIIDYSSYIPVFKSINYEELDDRCTNLKLMIDMDVDKLTYYTPGGLPTEVTREYTLDYKTMVWNSDNKMFMNEYMEETIKGNVSDYIVNAPLADTDYRFSGDQFASYFGLEKSMETPVYEAVAVESKVLIDSVGFDSSSNQITGDGNTISAPAEFTFTAYANEPVAAFYTWKVYNLDKSSTEPVSQTTSKILHYTFDEPGNYSVNLDVSDSKSTCTYQDPIKDETFNVSDFMLFIPNAFSPTTSPGVNDEFKVAYKSIVKFNAKIYSTWGIELFHWTDPSQGWDGKYRGKYVPPGTYYYIIEAESGTGQKYVRKGDVNIVGGK